MHSRTLGRIASPTVSIVIPNFNKAPFLAAAIDAVAAQGVCAEAIFVDDASTDGSLAILESAAAANRQFRLIRSANNIGGSACRNLGLEAARGEYVIFMDSDDLLVEGCCDARVRFAQSAPDHDMWIFPMSVFREDPARPVDLWAPIPGDHLRNFLAHSLPWHTMQPLWRTAFIRGIGGFDPAFPRLQDPEVHTKALLQGARVAVSTGGEPDCRYRIAAERHDSNATALAERHVTGTLMFYEKFLPQIEPGRIGLLTGTLLACQNVLLQWWRSGRLPARALDDMQRRISDACRLRGHQGVLRFNYRIQRASPVHIPGLGRGTKALLGIP